MIGGNGLLLRNSNSNLDDFKKIVKTNDHKNSMVRVDEVKVEIPEENESS